MLSLVVPTRNERGNIVALVERTEKILGAAGEPFELIIVDDASQDGTRDEVRRQAQTRPWLRLIARDHDCDLSTAVVAGWRAARGDVLGCMDADLQHPPELLAPMLAALRTQHADLVLASRYTAGGGTGSWSGLRRGASRAATAMAALLLPGALRGVTDPMSGFFMLQRSAVSLDGLRPQGYKILLETLARARPQRVVEVPFVFAERTHGESKASWKVTRQFLRQVLALASSMGELRRMLNFGLVGLSGVGVNYLVFWVLRGRIQVPLAGALASAAAIASNFAGDEFYTFRDAARAFPGARARLRRFSRFAGLSLIGLVINTATVTLLSGELPWWLALGIGIGLASTWNFFSNSTLTWTRPALPAKAISAGGGGT